MRQAVVVRQGACALMALTLLAGCSIQGRRLDSGNWVTSGITSPAGCISIQHPAPIEGLDTMDFVASFDAPVGQEHDLGGGSWLYVSNPWRRDCCPGVSISLRRRTIAPYSGNPLTALQDALVTEQEARVAALDPDHVSLGDPNSRRFRRLDIGGREWLAASRYSWGTLHFTHVDGTQFLEAKLRVNERSSLTPSAERDAKAALDRVLRSIRIDPAVDLRSCTAPIEAR